LTAPGVYCTIGLMKPHRISLTDDDIVLIVAALRARMAMTASLRKHRVARLVERLSEGSKGNPKWIHSEPTQTHEDEIDPDELEE